MTYRGKQAKKEQAHVYAWLTHFVYTWNQHDILNQLHSNNAFKKQAIKQAKNNSDLTYIIGELLSKRDECKIIIISRS